MKKKITLLVILAFASTSFAGGFSFFGKRIKGSGDLKTETRDVDRFDRIKMVGSFDVFVTVGKKQSIEITFDDNLLDNIETEVHGKTLILDSRKSYSSRKNCKIEITVPELEYVKLSGSGDIDTRDLIADDVYAKISGSGDIKVHASKSFDGKVSGSGDICYYGKPEHVDTKVSGSGSIKRKK